MVSSSLRNLGRAVARNQAAHTVDCRPVLDRVSRAGRSRADVAKSLRTIFEALENRQMLSVLPAPVVSNWTQINAHGNAPTTQANQGYNTTPSVAYDPVNPNNMVMVYQSNYTAGGKRDATGTQNIYINGSYSTDGGKTWTDFSRDIPLNLEDLDASIQARAFIRYTEATYPTVQFDRNHNFYISYTEHRTDNTFGALVLQTFDFSGNAPANTSQNGNLGGTPDTSPSAINLGAGKVLYQWFKGIDEAFWPTIAVDNNLTAADINALPAPIPTEAAAQADPHSGTLYYAWTTEWTNTAPVPWSNFNPNSILMATSIDGGVTFSPATAVNTGVSVNLGGGETGNQPYRGADRDVVPHIIISQGVANPSASPASVAPGTVTVEWDDINSDRSNNNDLIKVKTYDGNGFFYLAYDPTPGPVLDANPKLFTNQTTTSFTSDDYAVGTAPVDVLTYDVDGNKRLDAIVLDQGSGDITVLRGNGIGANGNVFAVGNNLATITGLSNPRAMVAADFDGDKILDLMVIDDNGLEFVQGVAGAPYFNPPATVFPAAGKTLTSITTGDFDGDKLADVAFTIGGTGVAGQAYVLESGTGLIGPINTNGMNAVSIDSADMDGDKNLDLIVANKDTGTIAVMLNDGTGAFADANSATTFTVGPNPAKVVTHVSTATTLAGTKTDLDINGDKLTDVLILDDNGVEFLANATLALLSFNTPATVALAPKAGEQFSNLIAGEFTGDQGIDIIVTDAGTNSFIVGQGFGTGTFNRNPPTFNLALGNSGTPSNPVGIGVGDFNGDSKLDLIFTNKDQDSVSTAIRFGGNTTLPQQTDLKINVPVGKLSSATTITDFDVELAFFTPSLDQKMVELIPSAAALAKIQAVFPSFGSWVLFYNAVDANGQQTGRGITGSNMGYDVLNNTAFRVGTVFDDDAPRDVTDQAAAPWTGHFTPENGWLDFDAIIKYMQDPNNFALGAADPGRLTPADFEGDWTLRVTDFRTDTTNGVPPPQYIDGWGINFALDSAGSPEVTAASTKVLGSLDGHNPLTTGVAANLGIGPGVSLAADKTLGAYSPYQGRIYMTYVNRSTATGNPADNTDVQLIYSDDGGKSWSSPVLVNDDDALTDGYSEGVPNGSITSRGRAQFNPSVTVDQYTGTLVITYSDARQDAARVRFANSLTTSLDGGSTFAPAQFLNQPNTAVDATTGKTLVLGPVPDNGTLNDDPEFGLGFHNDVVAVGGHVFAMWSGNMNGGLGAANRLPDILTANVLIAAGPRVISSTMGVVSQPGDLLNYPKADGTPVLRSFVLTFDRPVDYSTIFSSGPNQNIFLYYRKPGLSGNDPGTAILLNPTVFAFDAVTGVDLAIVPGMSVTSVRIELSDPEVDGAKVGTYSYYVNPTISDRIRKPTTLTNPAYLTRAYTSDAANSNLSVPSSGTGGNGSSTPVGTGPDDTTSCITIAGVPTAVAPDPVTNTVTSEVITGVTIAVNLLHTNDANLTLTLIAPDGSTYVLNPAALNSGRNLIKTVFSSVGGTDISTANAPYTGTFDASAALAPLVALLNDPTIPDVRNGTWKLVVTDNQNFDAGTLLNWTLTFSTSLTSDYLGNRMDQNGDATPGESAWSATTIGDVYANPTPVNDNAWDNATKTFHTPYNNTNSLPLIVSGPAVTNTHTYDSTDTPVVIPDATTPTSTTTVTSTIHIAGDPTQEISNLVVTIKDLQHGAADTLQISLKAPDGTVILLHRAELYLHGAGGVTSPTVPGPIANMIGLVFSDNGATFASDITDDNATTPNASLTPYTGVFKPEGLRVPGGGLASLNGKSLAGDWTLCITDIEPDGIGSPATALNAWSITATTTPVTVNPVQTDPNSTPSVNSIVVTFDHDMDPYLLTTPGAIPGLVSPVTSIKGPLGNIAITPSYTPAANQTNLPIPDNGSVSSKINVTDTYLAGHVTVNLNLSHANDQDLVVKLVAPDGTTSVTLLSGNGGTGANFTNTLLDDLAPTAIGAGTAPFSAGLGYQPVQSLDAALRGMCVKGTWTLQVTDTAGNTKTGVLNSWSLNVTPEITAVTAGDPAYDPTYTVPNRTFRIYIPDQKVSGSYSLTLSPQLGGTEIHAGLHDGLKLDSDHDAGLDALRDAVVAANIGATIPTVPYVYNQTTPSPIPVFDANTPGSGIVKSVLTITDSFDIQNLTVRLNASFANVPDLTVTLTAPDGTTVTLFNQFGAFGTNRANFGNTVFNDAASTPVQNGSAPYAASFKPQQALSAFVGHQLVGDWTLTISSKSTTIAGTLNNWSLTASKVVTNTGLGEAGADQATVNFRIFNMAAGNTSSSNQWTPVTSTGSSAVSYGSNSDPTSFVNNGLDNTTNTLSAGSITDIAVDPSDPSGNTVFVATASGGIWKTTNFLTSDPHGPTYTPLTDFGPVNGLNVGSIAVFGQTAPTPANVKLTGSLFATPGSYFPGTTADKAFDSSFQTFFWGPDADYDFVGYQFASPTLVTQAKFAPANSFGNMMVGGKIQGSLDGTNWTDLYTITSAPLDGTLTTVTLTNPGTFSYVRYLSPVGINAHAMISELQFFGPAANTVSAGASNKSVVIAGTGQGGAGYTTESANATNKVFKSPGVGFLLSTDGGSTWNLLDSLTNVDAAGNWLPIGSPQRDHKFLGTSTFKVVVDPRPSPSGDVIIYAALTGPNGGVYRSTDTGKHWSLLKAGDATDVILDYNSGTVNAQSNPTGNLNVIYAAFRGQGVFQSGNRGGSWTQLLGTAGGTPLVRDGTVAGLPALTTNTTADPNGAKGRISLAMPAPTGNAAADALHEGWIYAIVSNTDPLNQNRNGKLDGLYLTKDFGQNWTKISLDKITGTTFAPTNDPATGATFNVVDGSGRPAGLGNYDLTLTVDPLNPAIVYVGGSGDGTGFGIVRVDTTRVYDAHSFYTPLDAADGGKLTLNVNAAVATKNLTTLGAPNPFGTGNTSTISQNQLTSTASPQYLNLTTDPTNPFVQNGTFLVSNSTAWQNTGDDAFWHPIDDLFTMPVVSPNSQRVLSLIDPVTGQTRLILATDSGVYTTVTAADGSFGGSLGSNTVLANGSRNGNLDNAQVIQGAVQPGNLASQLAGAMFFAMTNTNGMVTSTGDVLTTGNVTGSTSYDTGTGNGIATDQTGSGTGYAFFQPGTLGTDFFQVFPPGTAGNNIFQIGSPNVGGIGRTFGLITSTSGTGSFGDTQDTQWPDEVAFPIAVNPVNGNQIVTGSYIGTIFTTFNQGRFWTQIAGTADLDGTIPSSFAFGAPDTSSDSTSNLIYVGTSGILGTTGSNNGSGNGTGGNNNGGGTTPTATRGQVFVTFTGGGNGAGSNAWVNLDSAGLDGSPVRSIVTSPFRGSKAVYVTTEKGVYYMPDSSAPNAKWTNITNNLTAVAHNSFGNVNYSELLTQSLTSITADWRYAIPNTSSTPGGVATGTHPVLYAAGNAGVYRSLDNGATWALFPNQSVDASAADGGYLPNVKVTDLDLSLGNIDPSTGLPVTTADSPELLVASTYGRGQYAIRVAPLILSPKFGPDTNTGDRTLTGLTQLRLNPLGPGMTFKVYDASDPTNLVDVTSSAVIPGSLTLNEDGTFSVAIDKNYSARAFAIQAIDAAGVVGPVSAPIAVPPPTLDTPALQIGQDTGVDGTDRLTNKNKPVIDNFSSGHAALPNAVITVYVDGSTTPAKALVNGAQVTSVTADSSGRWSFTFANALADGTHSIRVTQTDPNPGGLTSAPAAPLVITIDTVAPAGSGGHALADATTNVALPNTPPPTLAHFTDAKGLGGATINWGDGSGLQVVTFPANTTAADVAASHTYAQAGNYTITVIAVDRAGNFSSAVTDSIKVTPPVYNFTATGDPTNPVITKAEGSVFNGRVAIVTDAAPGHTTGSVSALINWGDGSAPTPGTIVTNTDGRGTFDVIGTHTYIDNRPTPYAISVTITAVDGKTTTASASANISNTVPNPVMTAPTSIYVGQTTSITVSATDASSADAAAGFTYKINWGDGSAIDTVNPSANNGAGVTLSHTFTSPSSVITVQAIDKDGGLSTIIQPVNVSALPTLASQAINGDPSRSDISQINFTVPNTTIAGGVSLSNLFLYYNGDGTNALPLDGASLAFDPASGSGTLDLSHLTTPLADGDYQLQIKVAGEVFFIPFYKLAGDLTGDGKVDSKDQSKLQQAMGKSAGQPGFYAQADLNHDGSVNAADLTSLGKLMNRKATGGTTTLTLQTGKTPAATTLNFGTVALNTNGGYIDLLIKDGNLANGVMLNIGQMSVSNPNFTFALANQAWGQPIGDNLGTIRPNGEPLKVRVYLKPVAKAQTLSAKLKFSFATISKKDYKDVTVSLKAVISNAAIKQAAAKAAKAAKKAEQKKHHK